MRTYFDSQEQAAAELAVSLDTLRDAKRAGCPAFRSGRVYRAEILAWLRRGDAPTGGEDSAALRHRKLKVEVERAEWEFEKTRDKHLPVSEFESALRVMLIAFSGALDAFAGRLNPKLEGLDYDGRADVIEAEIEIVRRTLAHCDYMKAAADHDPETSEPTPEAAASAPKKRRPRSAKRSPKKKAAAGE